MLGLSVLTPNSNKVSGKFTGLIDRPLGNLLDTASKFAQVEAVEQLDSLVAGPSIQRNLGVVRSTGFVDVRGNLGAIQPTGARIWSQMSKPRQSSIETGRPAGERVHTSLLRGWARRVGYGESLFKLAHQIRQRGVKGLFFMQKARKATEKKLPSLTSKMAVDVIKEFRKK